MRRNLTWASSGLWQPTFLIRLRELCPFAVQEQQPGTTLNCKPGVTDWSIRGAMQPVFQPEGIAKVRKTLEKIWVVCALRNNASAKWVGMLLKTGAILCTGFFAASCAGGLSLAGKDGPLIPVLNTGPAKDGDKARSSDGNGALLAASGKSDGVGRVI